MDKSETKDLPKTKAKASATAFLLSQVGAHASGQLSERLAKLNLTTAHAGIMRVVAETPALTQQKLATTLRTQPSRLVVLLDELEEKELIERRSHPSDRRSYSLHLTAKGEKAWIEINVIRREHQTELLSCLSSAEQKQLNELLQKIADDQDLAPNVHPAYRTY